MKLSKYLNWHTAGLLISLAAVAITELTTFKHGAVIAILAALLTQLDKLVNKVS